MIIRSEFKTNIATERWYVQFNFRDRVETVLVTFFP